MQVARKISSCPWNIADAILDTEDAPNIFRLNTKDPSWNVAINGVKSQGLRSATSTDLGVRRTIRLTTQIG